MSQMHECNQQGTKTSYKIQPNISVLVLQSSSVLMSSNTVTLSVDESDMQTVRHTHNAAKTDQQKATQHIA